ncbi:serine aminopeptidase domain-containing protein [Hutsoniella sourekii]|uniref:serine aminopeptidase domain-containing protein n=1 Tax=Hutsoniella sourekii TaxID=87650 RepID=UPI00048A0A4D|nr:alpha/beta hydrolase [Hutsoniella sourekii]
MCQITIDEISLADIPCLLVQAPQLASSNDWIIGYHGWTNVKESILTQAIAFARAGFKVVLPDAPHHGRRKDNQKEITQTSSQLPETLLGNLHEFPKLKQAIEEQFSLDRLSIFGTSMGGLTVSLIAGQYGQVLSGAIQYIASLDVSQQLGELVNGPRGQNLSEVDRHLIQDCLDEIQSSQLSNHLSQLEGLPLFVYNGGADDWIDASINCQLMDQVKQDYPHVAFIYWEDQDHWVPFEIIQASVNYLAKHLHLT